jgi:hypothetical protein
MTRKVQVQLFDDIDGSQADETMRFGLDGMSYEIDLSASHAEKLRASLAKFILSSRRVGRAQVVIARPRPGTPARVDRAQNQAVRDWARSKRIEISDRGRIPGHIVEQYQAEAGR